MSAFHPKLNILPLPQRRLWAELRDISPDFTLYGGTAIALHLGHRESIDFDFFGRIPFAPLDLAASLPFLHGAIITQTAPNTLSALVDRGGSVKVSFFGLPKIAPLRAPHIAAGIGLRIASLLDLAGTKASVVQQRAEAKDYVDIDAILLDGHITLPTALAAAQAIYGAHFAPQNTLKALTYFDDGGLRELPLALKKRLVDAVRAVDLDHLPNLAAAQSGDA